MRSFSWYLRYSTNKSGSWNTAPSTVDYHVQPSGQISPNAYVCYSSWQVARAPDSTEPLSFLEYLNERSLDTGRAALLFALRWGRECNSRGFLGVDVRKTVQRDEEPNVISGGALAAEEGSALLQSPGF